jgi:hypothetical protein
MPTNELPDKSTQDEWVREACQMPNGAGWRFLSSKATGYGRVGRVQLLPDLWIMLKDARREGWRA